VATSDKLTRRAAQVRMACGRNFRSGTGGADQHSLAGRTSQAHNRAQGLSCSDCVEEGPIPAIYGGCVGGLATIMRLHEEFGLSVSDDTIYRALHKLGLPHLSAQPRAYKQDAEAIAAFKNFAARVADIRQNLPPDTPIEVRFQMLWGRAALIFRPARTKQGSQPACNRTEHLFDDRAEHLTWLVAARLPTRAKIGMHGWMQATRQRSST
jgi:Winged helix-turn helix